MVIVGLQSPGCWLFSWLGIILLVKESLALVVESLQQFGSHLLAWPLPVYELHQSVIALECAQTSRVIEQKLILSVGLPFVPLELGKSFGSRVSLSSLHLTLVLRFPRFVSSFSLLLVSLSLRLHLVSYFNVFASISFSIGIEFSIFLKFFEEIVCDSSFALLVSRDFEFEVFVLCRV